MISPILSPLARFARSWANAVVLVLLVGVAWAGHHFGWTVPRFSELTGRSADEKKDWCEEHCVPESACVECHQELLPAANSYGWCRKHGVADCPFEHPEIAQLQITPIISPADLERARRALDLKDRQENNPKCKLHLRRVQILSVDTLTKMGIDVAPVQPQTILETVNASGEIAFEQPRVAPVYTSVTGRVLEVTARGRIGETAKKGDVLALIDSVDVGKAKTEFLQAFAQVDLRSKILDNLKPLAGSAISETRLREAEIAAREAQIRLLAAQHALSNMGLPVRLEDVKNTSPEDLSRNLQFLGMSADLVKSIDPQVLTANVLPVKSTRDGVVIASKVVAGEMVDMSKTLFVVADTSQMWLMLNVRSEDLKYLRARNGKTGTPGQKVLFRPDGTSEEITGELVWISKVVDEKTRTVQARVDLPNPEGKLLAHTFGIGRIVLREEAQAMVVPTDAVHWEGDCHVVFVRDKNFFQEGAPKVFRVRTVRPGIKTGRHTEIIAGLLPGEVVATRNSANLRAELLRSKLGDGCGCGH